MVSVGDMVIALFLMIECICARRERHCGVSKLDIIRGITCASCLVIMTAPKMDIVNNSMETRVHFQQTWFEYTHILR